MQEWIHTVLLGIIEGITEFLPISSTGHLLLAAHFMEDPRSEFFNVGIQSGAVLAVVLIYWRKILSLLLEWRKPENWDYTFKLGVAFMTTVVLGLTVRFLGAELPEDPAPVAWAVFIGALFIFLAEYVVKKREVSAKVTLKIAIAVGAAQVVAGVFPGTSRSAATIIACMLMGLSRMEATEFSFLLGIPTMFAATFYTIAEEIHDHGGVASEEWGPFALGFVVSAVVAFLAVKWLLTFIRSNTFNPFAWYRLVLGLGLLVWLYAWPKGG